MKCFYHIDPDGWCSGYWVKYLCDHYDYLPEYKYMRDDFIQFNYGFKFPFERIAQGEKVFIVDLSLSTDDMMKLLTITRDVVWIDHHKTAIERFIDFPIQIPGVRYDGLAASMLTYGYAMTHLNGKCPEDEEKEVLEYLAKKNAPFFTNYIADYDVWSFVYGDATRNFHAFINSRLDTHPCDPIWEEMNENFSGSSVNLDYIERICKIGAEIRQSNQVMARNYVNSKAMVGTFEGLEVCIVNVSPGFGNSTWFEDNPLTKDFDAWIIFAITSSYGKLKYSYSIYSKKHDVSEIAKKYSGGGHRGAAGFSTDDFIFASHDLVSLRKYHENKKNESEE